jgi:2-polyprenyl-3-methyl-5-hydroxy-6-metoxy-1,4-benzoquinol methylase
MWDQRYSTENYAYGTKPNDFLVEKINDLSKGKILCLGEGEGRNAVWLAKRGYEVTAVDGSKIGLKKAQRLAKMSGVSISTIHTDLSEFVIKPKSWDIIISIFCHLPPNLRADVHHNCVHGLRSGGVMLLEAYTPAQLNYKTGGPSKFDMMMDAKSLRTELNGLEFQHLQELTREVHEGEFHNGTGAVVQVLAKKV